MTFCSNFGISIPMDSNHSIIVKYIFLTWKQLPNKCSTGSEETKQ